MATVMRDGDRIAEPGYSDAPRVRLPPGTQHAGGTMLAVFGKYAVLIGALFSIGAAGEWLPDGFWKTLLTSFGYATSGLFVLCAVYEVVYTERKWTDEHPAPAPVAPPPVQVQVTHTEQRGEVTHTEVHEYPNPPSEAFIKWIFAHVGPGGRIPGERAIEDQWHEQSDTWLDVITREKLIEKIGTHPNAPRRIVAGVTLETAMQRFGYTNKGEKWTKQT